MAKNIDVGFIDGDYRFVGGDPSDPSSWEHRGIKVGTVDEGWKYKGGNPNTVDSWEDVRKPGLIDRVIEGAKNTKAFVETSLANDPQRQAEILAERERTRLPVTAEGQKIAQDISDASKKLEAADAEVDKAAETGDRLKTTGKAIDTIIEAAKFAGTGAKSLITQPRETLGMIAENLPNSLPGMAGGLVGAGAGAATPIPGGAVVGGLAGGFAGGYPIEYGASIHDQAIQEAQKRGIDTRDANAMAALIDENKDAFAEKARLKAAGTAGTDALLNVATLGVAGAAERTLVKAANQVGRRVADGSIDAATGAAELAEIEAKNAARNTLGAKVARGAGVTAGEMVGEGASEYVGQKMAYDNVNAGDVLLEGLLGAGQGVGMAAGRGLINKAGEKVGLQNYSDVEKAINANSELVEASKKRQAESDLENATNATQMADAAFRIADVKLNDTVAPTLGSAVDVYLTPNTPTLDPSQSLELAAAKGAIERTGSLDLSKPAAIAAPASAVTEAGDTAARAVEAAGGVATPAQAAVLDRAFPNQKMYDTVTETAQQPEASASPIIVPAAGNVRESVKFGTDTQEANNEGWNRLKAQTTGATSTAPVDTTGVNAQTTGATSTAPAPARVIEVLQTPPALQSAEQRVTLNTARQNMTPEDFQILETAAVNRGNLSSEQKVRLRFMEKAAQDTSFSTDRTQETEQSLPTAEYKYSTDQLGDGFTLVETSNVDGKPLYKYRIDSAIPSNTAAPSLASQPTESTQAAPVITTVESVTAPVAAGEAGSVMQGGVKHEFTEVASGASAGLSSMINHLSRIFGKKVVFFKSTLKADGFVREGNDKTIYINADSKMNPLAVFGHELMHLLKRDNPIAYRAIAAVVARRFDTETRAAFRNDYGRGSSLEELTSDLMGNAFTDETFLSDVITEIGKLAPAGEARSIIMRLAAAINKAVTEALKVVKAMSVQQNFKADGIVKNLEDIRTAMKQALATYAQQQREPATRMHLERMKAERTVQLESKAEPTETSAAKLSKQRNDFENPEDRLEVSTTKPTAKKSDNNSYDQKWIIDGEDVKATKKHVDAVINAISKYNTLTGKGNASKLMQELHDVVVDNLLWLHDLVPSDIRARAKLWYDGANRIANDWTKTYGVTLRQASGVLAVLSPQMDWFKNVSLAERVINIFKNRQNEAWSPAMTAWVESWVNASADVETKSSRQKVLDEIKPLEGVALSEMNLRQSALFVRVFDETYNERKYRLVTPEGGFGDYVTNSDDGDASVTWGGFDTIEKAISILEDGSFKNIDEKLGAEHKVRNFYNNIISPNSADGHVTIDTHAVAAALVKGLSGSSPEVAHNFGAAGGNAETGASGTYGLFADAYRDAAAKRGILAREMQSITWEAVRALFPAAIKDKLAPQINAIWDRFKKGEITRAQARTEVYDLAGGIRPMAWEGTDTGKTAADGGESYNTDLKENQEDRPVRTLEPKEAKDKISVTLSPNTDSIPGVAALQQAAAKGDAMAHKLLQDIALDNLRHLLAGTSAKIKAEGATGLYGGYVETSLSMTVTFTDTDRSTVLAAIEKFAQNFNQEQVHVRKETKEKSIGVFDDGSYVTPSYRWELNKALTRKNIESIIKQSGLYGLTFGDDFVEAYYVGDVTNEQERGQFYASAEVADRLLGKAGARVSKSLTRLWPYGRGEGAIGYERIRGDVSAGQATSSKTAQRVAEYLNAVKGKDGKLQPGKVKTFAQEAEITPKQSALQNQIARVFETLPDNDLKNPNVRKAYTELGKEVIRQFKAMPVKVEVLNGQGEPYANSAEMRRDLLDNNHLYIFGTTPETFGPAGVDFTGHPLLQDSGLKDQNGYPLLLNDLFRAVHDYYAHTMSPTQFGPKGEEAAWKNHMAMTDNMWARWALTAETRGQNSWVNFNDSVDPNSKISDREFARQKAVLLPVTYSLTGDKTVDAPMKEFIAKLNEKTAQGTKPEKASKIKASNQRLDMNFKDVTKHVPQLTEGSKALERGDITNDQYDALVKEFKPVTAYDFVPQPATQEDAERALSSSKLPRYGIANTELNNGERVGLRLDIPAYSNHGVWINSIHPADKSKKTLYGNVSSITNATFDMTPGEQEKAFRIAKDESAKSPFARIEGNWKQMTEDQAVAQANLALKSKNWTQVGMDPERHSYFYDRNDMRPVVAADEVIQIGPLVLAKNPTYGNKENFKFSNQRTPLAPNGKPSNLSPEQHAQVRTPAFKEWFGDWEKHANAENPIGSLWSDDNCSKAVDENGEPLVVYHGTTSGGFSVFDNTGKAAKVDGATYFSKDPLMSQSYSGTGSEIVIPDLKTREDYEKHGYEIEDTGDGFDVFYDGDRLDSFDTEAEAEEFLLTQKPQANGMRGLYPVFLNIRTPLEENFEGANWDGERYGQYMVINEDDLIEYNDEGKAYFTDYDEAADFAATVKGGKVQDAYSHYNSTDGVVREAQADGNDGAIIRDVVDMGPRPSPYYGEPTDVFVTFEPNQVKSATQNVGTFSASEDDIRLSPPRFYSQLDRVVSEVPERLANQPAGQWKQWLAANASKFGIKKEEIEWSGINDYLDMRGKEKVSKTEIGEFLTLNGVKVEDVLFGDQDKYWSKVYDSLENGEKVSGYTWDDQNEELLDNMDYRVDGVNSLEDAADYVVKRTSDTNAEYAQYVVPGGTKYKELLLTLGAKPEQSFFDWIDQKRSNGEVADNIGDEEFERLHNQYKAEASAKRQGSFHSSHWEEKNVLAHIRFDDRKDASGKKVLFINEIQSDWGQSGRKNGFTSDLPAGYSVTDKLNSTPDAPFVKDTKSWVGLAVKRIMLLAAQGKYDKVAFINGKQAADLYNLAKQIDYIEYEKTDTNEWFIKAIDHTGRSAVTEYGQTPEKLEALVGKDIAQKIVNDEGVREPGEQKFYGVLKNADLTVGGEGMMSFYDRIVPQVVNDVLKKLGVRTEPVSLEYDPNEELDKWVPEDGEGDGSKAPVDKTVQVGFAVTNEMREKLKGEGMPLFSTQRKTPTRQSVSDAIADYEFKHSIVNQVKFKLADMIAPGNGFNWFHKTVGTQFHKAKINPLFKKVFDLGQQFLDDVTAFATRAEDLAADIFPRFGLNRSLLHTGLSKADNELIGRALADGTLENGPNPHDGVVWSDEELRQKYKMTDKQIGFYRQARAAIDQSLDDLAKSEMATHMRIAMKVDISPLVRANLTLGQVRSMLLQSLDAGIQSATDPAAAKMLEKTKTQINGIYSTATNLKNHGYAPLTRFGNHTVTAYDENGDVAFFIMTDTKSEASMIARSISDQFDSVETGKMSKEDHKLFKGITPDSIELFAKHTGMSADAAMQEYLQLAVSSRSTMKRLINRKGTSGYSLDATRTLASFMTSNARKAASALSMYDMKNAADSIPKKQGDVRDEAVKLVDYIQNPGEEAAKLRGFLFFQFLGGSIASGIVNLTQPVMMTYPYLSQWGVAKAAASMKTGMVSATLFLRGKKVGDPVLQAALEKAKAEGIIDPQEIHQLMAASQSGAGSFLSHKFMRVWGANFGLTELFNRTITFAAAFKVGQTMSKEELNAAGATDAYSFAHNTISETQGLYNKGNRPNWARGAVGGTIFTFKQYSISYLEFAQRLYKNDKKAFGIALAILVMAAGIQGIPGADDLDDIIDTAGNWMGYATNTKKWKREFLESVLGKDMAAFALHGMSSLPGMPIDVQARLGLGNIIPGTGLLNPTKKDKAREVAEVFGVAGGLAMSTLDTADAVARGDVRRAALTILPGAVKNALQASEMARTGEYRDTRGRKVQDITTADVIAKGIGFQPAEIAAGNRRMREVQGDIDIVKTKQEEINGKYARAIVDDDKEALAEARSELADWNQKNPELPVRLNMSTIRQRVKQAKLTKEARFIKSAPKQIRGQVREAMDY